MKSLLESVKESLVNEAKLSMDIEMLIDMVNGESSVDDAIDCGLTQADYEWLMDKDNCKIFDRCGGYDDGEPGEGMEDALYRCYGLDIEKIAPKYAKTGIESDFPWDDEEIKDKKVLDYLGKECNMKKVACGGCYWTSGYAAPSFILFAEKNKLTDNILKNLEGWR